MGPSLAGQLQGFSNAGESVASPYEFASDQREAAEIAGRFGLWRIDARKWTIQWSVGVAHIFGRSLPTGASLSLEAHLSYYLPEDSQILRNRIEGAIAGCGPSALPKRSRIIRPHGELREVLAQGTAYRDDCGNVTALHGIVVDVTEMSQLEQRERTSAQLLRTTLESINQGILMVDADHRVRVHNRRLRDLLSVPEELLYDGAPFSTGLDYLAARGEFASLSDQERLRCKITTAGVYERRRQDGTVLEVRTEPLAEGGMVRTFTDVTERHRRMESERRFSLLADNTTDVFIWSDLDKVRRYVSPAIKTVLGYEPEEFIGTNPLTSVHSDDAIAYAKMIEGHGDGLVERGATCQRYQHKNGSWVWVEVTFALTRDPESGTPTGYVVTLRDISDRKKIEDALRVSEERLALALESGSDGLWDWDIASGELRVFGYWMSLLGYDEGEIEPHIQAWNKLMHTEDVSRLDAAIEEHVKGLTPRLECEYRIAAKNGDWVWTLTRGKVTSRDVNGKALRMVGTNIDITDRKQAEEAIAHMAVHDALTGLPNRVLFKDRLEKEIRNSERLGGRFAVLACDLDQFKGVNDSLGHSAGDALLTRVAGRLTAVLRDFDTIARLGGDEFAVILRRLDQPDDAHKVAERLIEAVEQPLDIDGHPVSIGMCVGIAIGLEDGRDPEQLFKNADIALYRAKAAGRNTCRFFERGMDTLIAERNILEHDLREAVRQNGFSLHYQPVIDVWDGSISGFEALLRWQHPTRGAISPAEFVPMAEENGLIVPLGEWVLREACQQAAAWPDVHIAVNVSAVQFQRPDALRRSVLVALTASGLKPHRLELEITESVLMQDVESSIACLHRLRELGVRIALDDFGTGYSSLSYLRRFPFSRIKIDKSFVQEIDDAGTSAIVRAVVGLARRVGASITAEGVETKEQFDHIREAGCTEVQGFLFSKPLSVTTACNLIQATRRQVAA